MVVEAKFDVDFPVAVALAYITIKSPKPSLNASTPVCVTDEPNSFGGTLKSVWKFVKLLLASELMVAVVSSAFLIRHVTLHVFGKNPVHVADAELNVGIVVWEISTNLNVDPPRNFTVGEPVINNEFTVNVSEPVFTEPSLKY